jgi:hypothetical protein
VIPLVGGPLEAMTIAALAIAGLIAWLRRPRGYRGPRLHDDRGGIDPGTLSAAEREVRDAPRHAALRARDGADGGPAPPGARSRSDRRSDRDRSGS